jgi:hypothetical protein
MGLGTAFIVQSTEILILPDFTRLPSVRIENAFLNQPAYLGKIKEVVEELGEKVHT